MMVYVVMGAVGDYSGRSEWVNSVFTSEADAERAAECLGALSREEYIRETGSEPRKDWTDCPDFWIESAYLDPALESLAVWRQQMDLD